MADGYMNKSKRDDWRTPVDFFERLHAEFNFVIDAAADSSNFLAPCFLGPGSPESEDALSADWAELAKERCGAVWCNPPYSRLKEFVRKSRQESDKGATVVLLIASRTDTKAFHEDIFPRAEVRFVKGRLKFIGAKDGAPFASAVVIFRGTEPQSSDDGLPPNWKTMLADAKADAQRKLGLL